MVSSILQFLEVEPDGSQSFGPAQFTEEDLETYCTEFNGSKKHLTGVSKWVACLDTVFMNYAVVRCKKESYVC